jgi:glycosyltransferase involved in cell wall biosynthesis
MISIVVPVFNEEESLNAFYKELTGVLISQKYDYEIIFIDDGSSDNSLDILKSFETQNKNTKIYSFRKNHGKAEALTLGFQKANGDYIITMDADLQDKPTEIPSLMKKLEDNWDVVSGWRKDRKDKKKMVFASRLFNALAKSFWGTELHDYNCGLKIYRKEAAKSLRLYGGLHRFIPLILHEQGFNVTEIPVEHEVRKYGKSKYGFSKVFKDLPDIFTMLFLTRYGKKPLHLFGTIGLGLLGIGAIIFTYLAITWLMGYPIGTRPLLTFSVLLMLGGLQIFFTGFLGELIISLSQREYKAFPLKYASDK